MFHTVFTLFSFKTLVQIILISSCASLTAAIPLIEGSDMWGDIQQPLSESLELPLHVWAPMTIGLSFHWPSKSEDDDSSHTTYVELPVHRKAILKPSSDISKAFLLSTTKPIPLPLSQQEPQDPPTRILSSRSGASSQEDFDNNRRLSSGSKISSQDFEGIHRLSSGSDVLSEEDPGDEDHKIWRNNPLEKPRPRTSGKRDLHEVESSTELLEQTGLPLHPHLVRIYKVVYTPTAWNSYAVPYSIASTITCYAYPKLSPEEKSGSSGRWSLFGRSKIEEQRISWTIDDDEVDFEDRHGRWFLQGREVEGWECRDW